MNLGLVLKSGSCAFLELVSESGFSSEDRSMVLVAWASLMPLCVAV